MKLQLLQVLRGIAATAVVLFHSQGLAAAYAVAPSVSGQLMGSSGGYGVDLFFVLSGFIIRHTEPQSGYEAGAFLRRRIARIVPLYWLSMLAVLALRWVVPRLHNGPPPELALVVKSLAFAAFTGGEFPLVYVGWSLEYELCFYLATALCIASTVNPWRYLVAAFSLFVAVGALLPVDTLPPTLAFILNPIVLEFALGAQLASGMRTKSVDPLPCTLLIVALGFVVASGSPLGTRVLVAGLPATALVAACAFYEVRRVPMKVPAILVLLGDASYSIYLGQIFLISGTAKVALRALPAINPDLLVLITTACSCLGGMLTYRYVERPITRKVTRWLVRKADSPPAGSLRE